jgi:hypothetical protein
LLYLAQQVIQLDQPLAIVRQLRAAAAFTPGGAFHHRLFRQLVHLIDGVPGAFVADARQFGALADGAGVLHLFQQRDAARIGEQLLLEFESQKNFGLHCAHPVGSKNLIVADLAAKRQTPCVGERGNKDWYCNIVII